MTRHNACINPAAKNNVTDWGGNMTPTQITGLTGFPRTTGARYDASGSFIRTPKGAANPGDTVTISCYVKSDGNTSGTLYIVPLNSGGGDITYINTSYSTTGGVVTRLSFTATMPANTVAVQFLIDSIVNVTVTCVLNETVGSLDTYFDGDSAGGSWDGTDGNSASSLSSGTSYNADATSTISAADSAGANLSRQGAATSTISAADSAGANLARQGAATSTIAAADSAAAARTTYGAATSQISAADTATALRTTTGAATSLISATDAAGANVSTRLGASSLISAADVAAATVTSSRAKFWPHAEMVAVEWVKGIAGISSNAVSTNLPRDSSAWTGTGFVQIEGIGGTPDVDVPLYRPDVTVHCWAVSANSNKPPWWMANQMAEIIKLACYGAVDAESPPGRVVDLPDAYYDARVLTVVPTTEPRRVLSDEARFAHYQFDIRLSYVAVIV